MRKTLTTATLVLALCCPVFAGEMHAPVAPAPPPSQPAPAIQGTTTDGEMDTPLTTDGEIPNGASDGYMGNGAAATFAQVLLNLLALS